MLRNEESGRTRDLVDRALAGRALTSPGRDHSEPRTIVIRQGSSWQALAFLCLSLLLLASVILGHQAVRQLDWQNRDSAATMARVERKIQQLEAGIAFDTKRRHLLLGMRDHIMRTNPRVSLGDAYHFAELAVRESERYPVIDPVFLLAIGIVESGYDPAARSPADARGLYQIWPSTGRLLARGLGWSYDDAALYDPEKNTQAAALYLDLLFSTYNDPRMVLAEYNGGPLNAGYLRAGAPDLARETRDYVPRVLDLYARLKDEFDSGIELQLEDMHRDGGRDGKTLGGRRPTPGSARSAPDLSPTRAASAGPSPAGAQTRPAH